MQTKNSFTNVDLNIVHSVFIYYVELPTKSIFLAFPFNYVPCGFVIFSPDLIGIFLIANHSIITYVLTFYFLSFSRINK